MAYAMLRRSPARTRFSPRSYCRKPWRFDAAATAPRRYVTMAGLDGQEYIHRPVYDNAHHAEGLKRPRPGRRPLG